MTTPEEEDNTVVCYCGDEQFSGVMEETDNTYIHEQVNTIDTVFLKNKMPHSLGFRKTDDINKYLGIRPCQTQSVGTHQVEFTWLNGIVGGKTLHQQFGFNKMVDGERVELGEDFIVQYKDRHIRQWIPVGDLSPKTFKLSFKIDLTGLKVENPQFPDGYVEQSDALVYNSEVLEDEDMTMDSFKSGLQKKDQLGVIDAETDADSDAKSNDRSNVLNVKVFTTSDAKYVFAQTSRYEDLMNEIILDELGSLVVGSKTDDYGLWITIPKDSTDDVCFMLRERLKFLIRYENPRVSNKHFVPLQGSFYITSSDDTKVKYTISPPKYLTKSGHVIPVTLFHTLEQINDNNYVYTKYHSYQSLLIAELRPAYLDLVKYIDVNVEVDASYAGYLMGITLPGSNTDPGYIPDTDSYQGRPHQSHYLYFIDKFLAPGEQFTYDDIKFTNYYDHMAWKQYVIDLKGPPNNIWSLNTRVINASSNHFVRNTYHHADPWWGDSHPSFNKYQLAEDTLPYVIFTSSENWSLLSSDNVLDEDGPLSDGDIMNFYVNWNNLPRKARIERSAYFVFNTTNVLSSISSLTVEFHSDRAFDPAKEIIHVGLDGVHMRDHYSTSSNYKDIGQIDINDSHYVSGTYDTDTSKNVIQLEINADIGNTIKELDYVMVQVSSIADSSSRIQIFIDETQSNYPKPRLTVDSSALAPSFTGVKNGHLPAPPNTSTPQYYNWLTGYNINYRISYTNTIDGVLWNNYGKHFTDKMPRFNRSEKIDVEFTVLPGDANHNDLSFEAYSNMTPITSIVGSGNSATVNYGAETNIYKINETGTSNQHVLDYFNDFMKDKNTVRPSNVDSLDIRQCTVKIPLAAFDSLVFIVSSLELNDKIKQRMSSAQVADLNRPYNGEMDEDFTFFDENTTIPSDDFQLLHAEKNIRSTVSNNSFDRSKLFLGNEQYEGVVSLIVYQGGSRSGIESWKKLDRDTGSTGVDAYYIYQVIIPEKYRMRPSRGTNIASDHDHVYLNFSFTPLAGSVTVDSTIRFPSPGSLIFDFYSVPQMTLNHKLDGNLEDTVSGGVVPDSRCFEIKANPINSKYQWYERDVSSELHVTLQNAGDFQHFSYEPTNRKLYMSEAKIKKIIYDGVEVTPNGNVSSVTDHVSEINVETGAASLSFVLSGTSTWTLHVPTAMDTALLSMEVILPYKIMNGETNSRFIPLDKYTYISYPQSLTYETNLGIDTIPVDDYEPILNKNYMVRVTNDQVEYYGPALPAGKTYDVPLSFDKNDEPNEFMSHWYDSTEDSLYLDTNDNNIKLFTKSATDAYDTSNGAESRFAKLEGTGFNIDTVDDVRCLTGTTADKLHLSGNNSSSKTTLTGDWTITALVKYGATKTGSVINFTKSGSPYMSFGHSDGNAGVVKVNSEWIVGPNNSAVNNDEWLLISMNRERDVFINEDLYYHSDTVATLDDGLEVEINRIAGQESDFCIAEFICWTDLKTKNFMKGIHQYVLKKHGLKQTPINLGFNLDVHRLDYTYPTFATQPNDIITTYGQTASRTFDFVMENGDTSRVLKISDSVDFVSETPVPWQTNLQLSTNNFTPNADNNFNDSEGTYEIQLWKEHRVVRRIVNLYVVRPVVFANVAMNESKDRLEFVVQFGNNGFFGSYRWLYEGVAVHSGETSSKVQSLNYVIANPSVMHSGNYVLEATVIFNGADDHYAPFVTDPFKYERQYVFESTITDYNTNNLSQVYPFESLIHKNMGSDSLEFEVYENNVKKTKIVIQQSRITKFLRDFGQIDRGEYLVNVNGDVWRYLGDDTPIYAELSKRFNIIQANSKYILDGNSGTLFDIVTKEAILSNVLLWSDETVYRGIGNALKTFHRLDEVTELRDIPIKQLFKDKVLTDDGKLYTLSATPTTNDISFKLELPEYFGPGSGKGIKFIIQNASAYMRPDADTFLYFGFSDGGVHTVPSDNKYQYLNNVYNNSNYGWRLRGTIGTFGPGHSSGRLTELGFKTTPAQFYTSGGYAYPAYLLKENFSNTQLVASVRDDYWEVTWENIGQKDAHIKFTLHRNNTDEPYFAAPNKVFTDIDGNTIENPTFNLEITDIYVCEAGTNHTTDPIAMAPFDYLHTGNDHPQYPVWTKRPDMKFSLRQNYNSSATFRYPEHRFKSIISDTRLSKADDSLFMITGDGTNDTDFMQIDSLSTSFELIPGDGTFAKDGDDFFVLANKITTTEPEDSTLHEFINRLQSVTNVQNVGRYEGVILIDLDKYDAANNTIVIDPAAIDYDRDWTVGWSGTESTGFNIILVFPQTSTTYDGNSNLTSSSESQFRTYPIGAQTAIGSIVVGIPSVTLGSSPIRFRIANEMYELSEFIEFGYTHGGPISTRGTAATSVEKVSFSTTGELGWQPTIPIDRNLDWASTEASSSNKLNDFGNFILESMNLDPTSSNGSSYWFPLTDIIYDPSTFSVKTTETSQITFNSDSNLKSFIAFRFYTHATDNQYDSYPISNTVRIGIMIKYENEYITRTSLVNASELNIIIHDNVLKLKVRSDNYANDQATGKFRYQPFNYNNTPNSNGFYQSNYNSLRLDEICYESTDIISIVYSANGIFYKYSFDPTIYGQINNNTVVYNSNEQRISCKSATQLSFMIDDGEKSTEHVVTENGLKTIRGLELSTENIGDVDCQFSFSTISGPIIGLEQSYYNLYVGDSIETIRISKLGLPIYSVSITPALPDGLTLDTDNFLIDGTPTGVLPLTNYVLSASNSAGEHKIIMQLEITNKEPLIRRYDFAQMAIFKDNSADDNHPVMKGIQPITFSVSPALPAGLSLDTTTGKISGVATAIADGSYTVTATNSFGSDTATIGISVTLESPVIEGYDFPYINYKLNVAVATNEPITSGGDVDSFAIQPTLPDGLVFDTSTGALSGTPTKKIPQAKYEVTATNASGSHLFELYIGVVNNPLQITNYTQVSPVYTVNHVDISPLAPTIIGIVESYSVSPSLPAGLTLDTSTGIISGKPTEIKSQATYTVTATGPADDNGVREQSTFDLSIWVLDKSYESIFVEDLNEDFSWHDPLIVDIGGGKHRMIATKIVNTFRYFKVFEYDNGWTQMGTDILFNQYDSNGIAYPTVDEESQTMISSHSHSFSADGNRLSIIVETTTEYKPYSRGKVYEWNINGDDKWGELGSEIRIQALRDEDYSIQGRTQSRAPQDYLSTSLNTDGTVVAFGSATTFYESFHDKDQASGFVGVYELNGGNWVIRDKVLRDAVKVDYAYFGINVALSDDGNTLFAMHKKDQCIKVYEYESSVWNEKVYSSTLDGNFNLNFTHFSSTEPKTLTTAMSGRDPTTSLGDKQIEVTTFTTTDNKKMVVLQKKGLSLAQYDNNPDMSAFTTYILNNEFARYIINRTWGRNEWSDSNGGYVFVEVDPSVTDNNIESALKKQFNKMKFDTSTLQKTLQDVKSSHLGKSAELEYNKVNILLNNHVDPNNSSVSIGKTLVIESGSAHKQVIFEKCAKVLAPYIKENSTLVSESDNTDTTRWFEIDHDETDTDNVQFHLQFLIREELSVLNDFAGNSFMKMSLYGNKLVVNTVSTSRTSSSYNNVGSTKVLEFDTTAKTINKVGQSLNGIDKFGYRSKLGYNGNILAINSYLYQHQELSNRKGKIQLFKWESQSNEWKLFTEVYDFETTSSYQEFGRGFSFSGNKLVIRNENENGNKLSFYDISQIALVMPVPQYNKSVNLLLKDNTSINEAPTLLSGVSTSYSITPALPAGLTFDEATGAISGIPTVLLSQSIFTCHAHNQTISNSTEISVRVIENKRKWKNVFTINEYEHDLTPEEPFYYQGYPFWVGITSQSYYSTQNWYPNGGLTKYPDSNYSNFYNSAFRDNHGNFRGPIVPTELVPGLPDGYKHVLQSSYATNWGPGNGFGQAISINDSGTILVVGAPSTTLPYASSSALWGYTTNMSYYSMSAGGMYIYKKEGNDWTLLNKTTSFFNTWENMQTDNPNYPFDKDVPKDKILPFPPTKWMQSLNSGDSQSLRYMQFGSIVKLNSSGSWLAVATRQRDAFINSSYPQYGSARLYYYRYVDNRFEIRDNHFGRYMGHANSILYGPNPDTYLTGTGYDIGTIELNEDICVWSVPAKKKVYIQKLALFDGNHWLGRIFALGGTAPSNFGRSIALSEDSKQIYIGSEDGLYLCNFDLSLIDLTQEYSMTFNTSYKVFGGYQTRVSLNTDNSILVVSGMVTSGGSTSFVAVYENRTVSSTEWNYTDIDNTPEATIQSFTFENTFLKKDTRSWSENKDNTFWIQKGKAFSHDGSIFYSKAFSDKNSIFINNQKYIMDSNAEWIPIGESHDIYQSGIVSLTSDGTKLIYGSSSYDHGGQVKEYEFPSGLALPVIKQYSSNNITYQVNEQIEDNVPAPQTQDSIYYYSISPYLPAGLRFNTETGVLSGTPTEFSSMTDYTVMSYNEENVSQSFTLSFRTGIKQKPLLLTYDNSSKLQQNVVIPPYNLVHEGDLFDFNITPSLPDGININTNGELTGLPHNYSSPSLYTITNDSSGIPSTLQIKLDIMKAALVYDTEQQYTYTLSKNKAEMQKLGPNYTSAEVDSYVLKPDIPPGLGLTFNTSTGYLSGTPTATFPDTPFTLIASNNASTVSIPITIKVISLPPIILGYTSISSEYTQFVPALSNTPSILENVKVDSFSVDPPLPTGLVIGSTTGIISGTPTVSSAATDYTVTATNQEGSSSTSISITIIENNYSWIQGGTAVPIGNKVAMNSDGTRIVVADDCGNQQHLNDYSSNPKFEWIRKVTENTAIPGHVSDTVTGLLRVYERQSANNTIEPFGWIQVGNDIGGTPRNQNLAVNQIKNLIPGNPLSGMAMSGNGEFIIYGNRTFQSYTNFNDDYGYFSVLKYDGSTWSRVPITANGNLVHQGPWERSGYGTDVAISYDGSVIAVSAIGHHEQQPDNQGFVDVFKFDPDGNYYKPMDIHNTLSSTQAGRICNAAGNDGIAFGKAIDMNDAGTRLVIADNKNIRVYSWQSDSWKQFGPDIPLGQWGFANRASVSMDDTGDNIAVGISRYYASAMSFYVYGGGYGYANYYVDLNNKSSPTDGVHAVMVFSWDATNEDWVQKGRTLTEDQNSSQTNNHFGENVVLNAGATRIAISMTNYRGDGGSAANGSRYGKGAIALYDWNGTDWEDPTSDKLVFAASQRVLSNNPQWDTENGININSMWNTQYGFSLAMSKDGSVVIGGTNYDKYNLNHDQYQAFVGYPAYSSTYGNGHMFTYKSRQLYKYGEGANDGRNYWQKGWGVANGFATVHEYLNPNLVIVNEWAASAVPMEIQSKADRNIAIDTNEDGTRLVVGEPDYSGGKGRVKIYEYNSATMAWDQIGNTLTSDWDSTEANFGTTVSMSNDGNRVAIGAARQNDEVSAIRKHFYVSSPDAVPGGAVLIEYNSSTNSWDVVTKHFLQFIAGYDYPVYDNSKIVSLSGDGKIIIIGTRGTSRSGKAYVAVEDFDSTPISLNFTGLEKTNMETYLSDNQQTLSDYPTFWLSKGEGLGYSQTIAMSDNGSVLLGSDHLVSYGSSPSSYNNYQWVFKGGVINMQQWGDNPYLNLFPNQDAQRYSQLFNLEGTYDGLTTSYTKRFGKFIAVSGDGTRYAYSTEGSIVFRDTATHTDIFSFVVDEVDALPIALNTYGTIIAIGGGKTKIYYEEDGLFVEKENTDDIGPSDQVIISSDGKSLMITINNYVKTYKLAASSGKSEGHKTVSFGVRNLKLSNKLYSNQLPFNLSFGGYPIGNVVESVGKTLQPEMYSVMTASSDYKIQYQQIIGGISIGYIENNQRLVLVSGQYTLELNSDQTFVRPTILSTTKTGGILFRLGECYIWRLSLTGSGDYIMVSGQKYYIALKNITARDGKITHACSGVSKFLIVKDGDKVYEINPDDSTLWTGPSYAWEDIATLKLSAQENEAFDQVSAWDHYLVRTTSGSVYGWGENKHLQVGIDSREEYINQPTKLVMGNNFSQKNITQQNSSNGREASTTFAYGVLDILATPDRSYVIMTDDRDTRLSIRIPDGLNNKIIYRTHPPDNRYLLGLRKYHYNTQQNINLVATEPNYGYDYIESDDIPELVKDNAQNINLSTQFDDGTKISIDQFSGYPYAISADETLFQLPRNSFVFNQGDGDIQYSPEREDEPEYTHVFQNISSEIQFRADSVVYATIQVPAYDYDYTPLLTYSGDSLPILNKNEEIVKEYELRDVSATKQYNIDPIEVTVRRTGVFNVQPELPAITEMYSGQLRFPFSQYEVESLNNYKITVTPKNSGKYLKLIGEKRYLSKLEEDGNKPFSNVQFVEESGENLQMLLSENEVQH